MVIDLSGKNALVTGAAQGIGLAIAKGLCNAGAHVIIADINGQKAQSASDELTKEGYKAIAMLLDVSSVDSIEDFANQIMLEYQRIDILVNNAGISGNCELFNLTEDEFDSKINVNLRSVVFLSKYFMKQMKGNGGGRIVNIASLAGERGGKFASVSYSASKGGVIAATKSLALIGAEYGVNVNAVAPGLIATDMGLKLNLNADEVPMKRLGTPEEVADGVVFLCSGMASYITGTTLDVNGGILMR